MLFIDMLCNFRKTLSLLCASLAWQQSKSEDIKRSKLAIQSLPSAVNAIIPTNTSVIIYASRTHSQLTQVVKELKSTAYRPKITVLGSRDQLCIHERLTKLKGNALNQACSNLSTKRS
jgi:regulator of telomere elongation helicase 1